MKAKPIWNYKITPIILILEIRRAEYKIPNGESGIEFSKRILQAFNEMINIMDNEKKSTSALVCHGGVIMALFARFCKESDDIYYYYHG